MASASRDGKGWRVNPIIDGRRRTIRLPSSLSERQADSAAAHISALAGARAVGASPDATTLRWLSGLSDRIYARLAGVGLVDPRAKGQAVTIGQLLEAVFGTLTVKPGTALVYGQTRTSMEKYFTTARALSSIGSLDIDGWRRSMADEKLAGPTISKRVKTARMFFARAVTWKMITENPLAGVRAGRQDNPERARFIERETVQRVLDACPDHEWRLIVGLSRYAGLRCPSEHLTLTWPDWDVGRGALTVHGKMNRVRRVPVAPELAVLLQETFDAAEPGATFVITRYRDTNSNLRTQLNRILGAAGVDSWPRLFHNLRASCQSEWTERYPLASVCRWLGNTPAVAAIHYLQARDSHFDAATTSSADGSVAHGVAQRRPATPRSGRKSSAADERGSGADGPELPEDAELCGLTPAAGGKGEVTPRGSERGPDFPSEITGPENGGTAGGTLPAPFVAPVRDWLGLGGRVRRAFTLVELLVVVAVIALLVGLVLPGLAGARRTAKSAACRSNLRQISASLAVYLNEHPRARWWGLEEIGEQLQSRVGSCPAADPEITWSYQWAITMMGPGATAAARIEAANPSTVVVAQDFSPWHSHRNAGYFDGHAARLP